MRSGRQSTETGSASHQLTEQHVTGVLCMQELTSYRNVQLGSLKQARDLLGQEQGHLLSLALVLYFLSLVRIRPGFWID